MSLHAALNFVANEILACNESLPVVVLETHDGVFLTARTQGCEVTFKAPLCEFDSQDESQLGRISHAAALLTADESIPVPEHSVAMSSVRVWIEDRLRPDARPIFNGHDRTVWPEMDRYRH
jgi:hypothetical protein